MSDQIKYIILLGPREAPKLLNIPQDSLIPPLLRYLGSFPQSMRQFIYGVGPYRVIKEHSLQLGYDVLFMHPDATEEDVNMIPWSGLDVPVVLMLCTADKDAIDAYNGLFRFVSADDVLCIVSETSKASLRIPCEVATDERQVWEWLLGYAYRHYTVRPESQPFSVPLFPRGLIEEGNVFSPSRVNTQIINAIQGNWDYAAALSREDSLKMRTDSSKVAFENPDGSARQKILIEQIRKIRRMEALQGIEIKKINMLEEHYRAPLILAAPYTSVEMRKGIDRKSLSGEDAKMAALYEQVMDAEYTKNYTVRKLVKDQASREVLMTEHRLNAYFVDARMSYLDNVAMLHCSVRFSPYFRMPILGKNINAELSFVGIKNLDKIAYAKSRNQSIRKAMAKIGNKISSTALCPETIHFLRDDCAQVVAMTDLPIEWMMLDGVPFGFSHDVCRLPETPVQSLLAQYVEAKWWPYTIPQDILSRTLVVYGNDDENFVLAQEAVEAQKSLLGFQARRCLSKQDFFDTVKEVNPDLLIVDCHGNVDPDTHQSYLVVGKDIVTGDDVVGSGIHPRLVFLSACNTFTAYNSVGTIANAFFEVGACAVTTSYMPLDVVDATILYIRLLRNLSEAARKSIHRNWLSFVSHLLRTSYIHAPLKGEASQMTDGRLAELAELSTKSMFFNNRRKIYNGFGADYDYIVPHYLMYSTLGRADLIRFQSFQEEVMPEEVLRFEAEERRRSYS